MEAVKSSESRAALTQSSRALAVSMRVEAEAGRAEDRSRNLVSWSCLVRREHFSHSTFSMRSMDVNSERHCSSEHACWRLLV